jgi:hypothetical protein
MAVGEYAIQEFQREPHPEQELPASGVLLLARCRFGDTGRSQFMRRIGCGGFGHRSAPLLERRHLHGTWQRLNPSYLVAFLLNLKKSDVEGYSGPQ